MITVYRLSETDRSLPDIFVPLVRLETLSWDPLLDGNFERLPWFSTLNAFIRASPLPPKSQVHGTENTLSVATPLLTGRRRGNAQRDSPQGDISPRSHCSWQDVGSVLSTTNRKSCLFGCLNLASSRFASGCEGRIKIEIALK